MKHVARHSASEIADRIVNMRRRIAAILTRNRGKPNDTSPGLIHAIIRLDAALLVVQIGPRTGVIAQGSPQGDLVAMPTDESRDAVERGFHPPQSHREIY